MVSRVPRVTEEIQKIILDYFEKKNLTQSATIFVQETEKAKNQRKDLQTVLESLKTGDFQQFRVVWTPKFEDLWKTVDPNSLAVPGKELNSKNLLILDLKMHFWFLSREVKMAENEQQGLSPEIQQFFAEYLLRRGAQLTGVPSLAKYFTIPYIKRPKTNPIFVESFSKGWFDEICQQLERFWLNKSPQSAQSVPTRLETCIANFSKFRNSAEPIWGKSQSSADIKLMSRAERHMIIKSTENRKILDMLSRRESLSIGRADVSEVQSSSHSEVIDTRRKMFEYKLLLQQKEHHMRMKDWESKECLEKSHRNWIYFVR